MFAQSAMVAALKRDHPALTHPMGGNHCNAATVAVGNLSIQSAISLLAATLL